MPVMVGRDKWILYKHTSDYELIKAVALDIKNRCGNNISKKERYRMQERLEALNLYHMRNSKDRPLDSINHRINTLEYYMFGYEDSNLGKKRFIFSPLGNLFVNNIKSEKKLPKIFATMLFAIQFSHPASGTAACFQLYPFRLIFQLLIDKRLGGKLYNTEYAYIIAFIESVSKESYENIVESILEFRKKKNDEVIKLLKEDEHTYVNCIYEWQYYTQKILESAKIIKRTKGNTLCKLYHPSKTNTTSKPTGRNVTDGYVELNKDIYLFINKMLNVYSCFSKTLCLNDSERLQSDIIKEIYSFYPKLLLDEIQEESSELEVKLLELPKLINEFAQNPNNETAYLFEDVLTEGFNTFWNVQARKIGGAGHTDIECLYLNKRKKFAVDAKSTANKLTAINSGRLRGHREEIGAEYTIVVTSRYVPAVKKDIYGNPIVIILASTFSEYLYNHLYHDLREIDYEDFDKIIVNNLGTDISPLISNMTMEKFATL